MGDPEAHRALEAIRTEIDGAANVILTEAEASLRSLAGARQGVEPSLAELEGSLGRILQACAFHDIVGQRLAELRRMLSTPDAALARDPLLNGPALPGEGLDQAAIDALLQGGAR
ncbi:MAG: hypothetical protein JSR45_04895 [Proteobacteria bacterium]|nr:hypothetical protein [Pseudomonadota bacterium]